MCLCLDLSFPSVVWLDPHVSMFVHVLVAFSTYLCFMPCQDPSFLCVVCLNLYAHMLDIMSMVTPCLDLHVCMHVLCSYAYVYAFTCLYAWICVLPCFYAHIHMLTYLFPCLYVPNVLCHLPYACALHAMFVCLDLGYVCHAMCYCRPFVHFVTSSCVLAYRFGPDLDPMVFVIIHTPWPISKGLDHLYLHVYACLLLCFMFVLAFLILGFVVLNTLRGLDLVWLHPTLVRPCSNVTI